MLALNRSATLATWPFRNSPWHLGQDDLLTILFSADSLTLQCRDYETYRYTVTLTLGLWQQRTSLRLVPKVITVTMIRVIHPHQCLSQDLDFFQKKELLKFFRELFAKERSYPFHDENLANVYQMRILYARTCHNHLVNRRFRTL